MNGNGQMPVTRPGAELIESERLSKVREKALVRAVSLHLAGKAEEALLELDKAIAAGEISLEIHSARSKLLQELEQSAVASRRGRSEQ